MKALIIADAVEKLKPASDTSLAIAEQLHHQGVGTYFTTDIELIWEMGEIFFKARRISQISSKKIPEFSAGEVYCMEDFSVVLIRKDPPFDQSYVKLCWLLSPFQGRTLISNKPSLILQHHEKLLPIDAVIKRYLRIDDLIPTCFATNSDMAEHFVRGLDAEKIVLKPFYGFAGSDVHLLDRQNFRDESEPYFAQSPHWIVQPFDAKVVESGDARIFFINGKFKGGFARMPKAGDFVSNLAQGGTAVMREFEKKEMQLIRRIERWVKHLKLDFVGADLIGSRINEMNITSPTGFRSYQELTGVNLAETFVEGLLKKCRH
jgi:glutathione synthase